MEETVVMINDKTVTLGEQINSQEWHCTYTVGSDSSVFNGTAKFYDVPNEPAWASQTSVAFNDYLYVDHSAPWLLLNHISGNTTVGTPPLDPQCLQIYTSAQHAATLFQIQLYQKTGFFQNNRDPATYVFTDDFSSCRVVNLEQVLEFEKWPSDQAIRYIIGTVGHVFDPNLRCGLWAEGPMEWFKSILKNIVEFF